MVANLTGGIREAGSSYPAIMMEALVWCIKTPAA
jgi:hypothetical protein